MALAMARPWKHPKTGIYWFRKRVPDELRCVVKQTLWRTDLYEWLWAPPADWDTCHPQDIHRKQEAACSRWNWTGQFRSFVQPIS